MIECKAAKVDVQPSGTGVVMEADLAQLSEDMLADGKVLLDSLDQNMWELHT